MSLTDDVRSPFEMVVQDLLVAVRLAPIAVYRVVESLGRGELKVYGLTGKRSKAGRDEQQPGEQLRTILGSTQELAGLLREVDQNCRRIEDTHLAAPGPFC